MKKYHNISVYLKLLLISVCISISLVVQAQLKDASSNVIQSEAIRMLHCEIPSEKNPVTLAAILVKGNESGEITVVIKVCMARGWHLYAYVTPELPYLISECVLNLPQGVTTVGDWTRTSPTMSITDKGVLIWENQAVFTRRLKVETNAKGVIETGLYYQTCNWKQCLPPVEKIFKLEI